MDSLTTTQVILTVFGIVATAVFSWWAWQSKQTIGKVSDHDIRIVRLEEKSVTPDQVRSIIHQSQEPVRQSINVLTDQIALNSKLMQDVLLQLAREEGRKQALKDLQDAQGK